MQFSGTGIAILGALLFFLILVFAMRARERRITTLLGTLGSKSEGVVLEFSAGEDGYNVTYSFVPGEASAAVERTESLDRRPSRAPRQGDKLSVLYLPGLPSISRADFTQYN